MISGLHAGSRWLGVCMTALAVLLPARGWAAGQPGPLPPPAGEVILQVAGQIERFNVQEEAHLTRALLDRLPGHELLTHTVVTDGRRHFAGFLMRDLLAWLGAPEEGTVVASALNDYIVEIPIEDFHRYDVIVAHTQDGQALTPRDKGPLWIVYPRDDHEELDDIRYDYRWVWQLTRIEVK